MVRKTEYLVDETGSVALAKPEAPPVASTTVSQRKNARAMRSRLASQTWIWFAGDSVRKADNPNSICPSELLEDNQTSKTVNTDWRDTPAQGMWRKDRNNYVKDDKGRGNE